MEIGIVGLGLIGGSLAKAISQNTDNTVYGCDTSDQVVKKAVLVDAIEQPLNDKLLSQCDIVIVALYNNASMIFTATKGPIESMSRLKDLFTAIGFTNIEITTPEEHDRLIAFTSQLAHVVSNAYIKSPTAQQHAGFSAGSYKDLTRVAKLNEDMWTELFLENPENLTYEIDTLMENLQKYRDAISSRDAETLRRLLRDGREKKAIIDGEIF